MSIKDLVEGALPLIQAAAKLPVNAEDEQIVDQLMAKKRSDKAKPLTRLSPEAEAARRPPPPDQLVGALQDPVHLSVGVVRLARSKKVNLILYECPSCKNAKQDVKSCSTCGGKGKVTREVWLETLGFDPVSEEHKAEQTTQHELYGKK